MKISMFKFYKTSFVCFLVLGLIIIVGSISLAFCFEVESVSDCIFLLMGLLMGLLCAVFPILINYRQLTHVLLKNEKYISYSFFNRELCEVKINEKVYYSFFYVRFAYANRIKFIAISNEPFVCRQSAGGLFEKKFYGAYNRNKIIIFPYDELTMPMLVLDGWDKIN